MSTLLLYIWITSALYYLGTDATITYPIRIRLPDAINRWLLCPACSGFWYGIGIGAYGAFYRDWNFLGLAPWEQALATGFGAMIWTPLVASLHLHALAFIHHIHTNDADG